MPQMAPMNWLCLFTMFILIYMIFNSLNYYCFLYIPKKSNNFKKKSCLLNWKW